MKLNDRELDVLAYLAEGLSDKEIARIVDRPYATVRAQVRSACFKLKLNNRVKAAVWYVRNMEFPEVSMHPDPE